MIQTTNLLSKDSFLKGKLDTRGSEVIFSLILIKLKEKLKIF